MAILAPDSQRDGLPSERRRGFAAAFGLMFPYLRSEERSWAWLLLSALVVMNVGLVYLNVLFTRWNKVF